MKALQGVEDDKLEGLISNELVIWGFDNWFESWNVYEVIAKIQGGL